VDRVVLDHCVGQQCAGNLLEGASVGGGVELELEALALADTGDVGVPEADERSLDGLTLRVEDLRLEHDVDDDARHGLLRLIEGREGSPQSIGVSAPSPNQPHPVCTSESAHKNGWMAPRVSVITLGTADLARSRAFYEAMGWITSAEPDDDVVFFQSGGMVFALWSRSSLAKDSCVTDSGGWGGVTLAHNVGSPSEVDAVLAGAATAGATIGRAGEETFWGGYSGLFLDPDGHPWEVAHNPFWTRSASGDITLPR